jgi:hypothetical protein
MERGKREGRERKGKERRKEDSIEKSEVYY